jgi:hypothetical protein
VGRARAQLMDTRHTMAPGTIPHSLQARLHFARIAALLRLISER